jgi:hypothetical protein
MHRTTPKNRQRVVCERPLVSRVSWLVLVASAICTFVAPMAASGQAVYDIVTSFEEGFTPVAGVIQASDGRLYGTTHTSLWPAGGTLFASEPSGVPVTLHYFSFAGGGPASRGAVRGNRWKSVWRHLSPARRRRSARNDLQNHWGRRTDTDTPDVSPGVSHSSE